MSFDVAKHVITECRSSVSPDSTVVCILTQGGHTLRGFRPFLGPSDFTLFMRPETNSSQLMAVDVAAIVAGYIEV